jgi:glycosyltransferase involved in cell wall biosynthesis
MSVIPPPKVSVIIPSYKTGDLIATCLDSVFAQTYTDFEVIVVNDGSPDTLELEKVLAPYLGRIVYIRQENKRAAGARNHAIRLARGEFLAFLDSDDSWLPHHLDSQMQLLATHPSLDLVYADAAVGDPAHQRFFMKECPSEGPATFGALVLKRCHVPVSTVVIRKQKIVEAGFFDETLTRWDDYDMWLRCAFHGAEISYARSVQACLSTGRAGSLGISGARNMEACCHILDKLRRTLPLSDTDREVVDRRATEVKALYLLYEGKDHLAKQEFGKARELISGANAYLHRPTLSLAVFGLGIAPHAANLAISCWRRVRSGVPGRAWARVKANGF